MFLHLRVENSLLIWYIWLIDFFFIALGSLFHTYLWKGKHAPLVFSSGKLRKKEKNEDIWFWQYLSWHLTPLLERANGEWSQCQRNSSRQKVLLRNQNKLQMHLDKQLGISPPTYEQSVAVFLLLHLSRVRPDLVCVWDVQAPRGTWVFICKQSCFWILHTPVLAQGTILRFSPKSWPNWYAWKDKLKTFCGIFTRSSPFVDVCM